MLNLINNDLGWLTATATLCILMLVLYISGIIWRKKSFDLNVLVPLLLGCAASVAAIKMIVLAFTLPAEIQGTSIATLFDSGSIFVGGMVFFLTALYQALKIILDAFSLKPPYKQQGQTNGYQ